MTDKTEAQRLADKCGSLATIADAYDAEAYAEAAALLLKQEAALKQKEKREADLLAAIKVMREKTDLLLSAMAYRSAVMAADAGDAEKRLFAAEQVWRAEDALRAALTATEGL